MNALTTTQAPNMSLGMLDPGAFDHMQRVGKMLALSPLFPAHLRAGSQESAIANGVLVINMALRLREDPLTVAQNIYFVGGRPGWASSYMIGKANQHGVFRDPIDWDITGTGDTLSVTAFATLAKTGKRVETTCDMTMAKAEGWTKNAKYQSMPKTMLRYRSASALIRFYCPEVMIGLPAGVENELPMRDVTPDFDDEDKPATKAYTKAAVDMAKAHDEDNAARQKLQDERDRAAAAESAKAQTIEAKAEPVKEEAKPAVQEKTSASTTTAKTQHAPDPEQFLGLLDLILADLDAASVEEVEGMYGPQIEQMHAHAPDLHRKLVAAFEAKAA